jgi:TDG/mug DNA glycosylase family protein
MCYPCRSITTVTPQLYDSLDLKYTNQMGSSLEEVKQENLPESSDLDPQPPSFKGKFNIASYAFSPNPVVKTALASPSPRRSPLKYQASPETAIESSPTPKATLKRKSNSTLTPSPSPKKKSRSPSGYRPPSTYAHLPELQDVLAPNLICIFVGLNPGIQTAVQGHAYAHPSNLFWKLLHSSGCTSRRCAPSEDGDLPRLFELGNTNIVSRPTRNGSELSKGEMDESVHVLEEKIRKYKPEAVCIVGKSIWESIWRVRHGGGKKMKKEEFRYGWQDEERNMAREVGAWEGAKVFVACSTSGLAATLLPAEKEKIWRELGAWVEERRGERSSNKVQVPL